MNDSVGSLVLFWTGVKCDRSGRSVCFSLSIGLWNSQIGDVCQTPEHWGDGRPPRASRLLLHAFIRSLLPPLSASMGTMNRRACSVPADLCLLGPSSHGTSTLLEAGPNPRGCRWLWPKVETPCSPPESRARARCRALVVLDSSSLDRYLPPQFPFYLEPILHIHGRILRAVVTIFTSNPIQFMLLSRPTRLLTRTIYHTQPPHLSSRRFVMSGAAMKPVVPTTPPHPWPSPQDWPAAKVRSTFIEYFKNAPGAEHTFWPSSGVIPFDDDTLLFANAVSNNMILGRPLSLPGRHSC